MNDIREYYNELYRQIFKKSTLLKNRADHAINKCTFEIDTSYDGKTEKQRLSLLLVMSLGGLFNTNFEQVFGFQNVYTQEATEVINTLIYRTGIQNGKYSLATAFGLSQGIVTVVLLFFANTFCKKLFDISIW